MGNNEYNNTLSRIEMRLNDIDKKLDNHITHVVADISSMKKDIEWIKNFAFKAEPAVNRVNQEEIKTITDVSWLKKIIWSGVGMIGTVIASLIIKYL